MSVFIAKTADTPVFRILEFFIEARELDHAISDVLAATGVSRSTFYAAWPALLKNGYIHKTRVVGKTHLYALNMQNPYSVLYTDLFTQALKDERRLSKVKM